MCSEALISEFSSLHSCALMHKPVLFTEVYTFVQVHASMHMYCELNNQKACLVSGDVAHWNMLDSRPKIYLQYFQLILGVTTSWILLI